jgi:3-oxoacyl-[acyl-carrier-protein] synthase II
MGFICLKITKYTSYGIKASCCDGFRCSTPIGNNVEEYWNALINGVSGAAPITYFDPAKFRTHFACELKNFNAEDFLDRKEARKMDRYAQYAWLL